MFEVISKHWITSAIKDWEPEQAKRDKLESREKTKSLKLPCWR